VYRCLMLAQGNKICARGFLQQEATYQVQSRQAFFEERHSVKAATRLPCQCVVHVNVTSPWMMTSTSAPKTPDRQRARYSVVQTDRWKAKHWCSACDTSRCRTCACKVCHAHVRACTMHARCAGLFLACHLICPVGSANGTALDACR
jgi:hypothetical protein